MVCAELGIAYCEFTNGAAYISSWLETLRSDRKEIFRAAADAQRIADYLLALHPDYAVRHLAATITAFLVMPSRRPISAAGCPSSQSSRSLAVLSSVQFPVVILRCIGHSC